MAAENVAPGLQNAMQAVAEALCGALASGRVDDSLESRWKANLRPDYASLAFVLPSNPALVVAFGNLAAVGPLRAAVHPAARSAAGLAIRQDAGPEQSRHSVRSVPLRDLGWTDVRHARGLGNKFVVCEAVPGWSSPAPCASISLGWRSNPTDRRAQLTCAAVKNLAELLGIMLRPLYGPLMKEVAGLTYWGTPVSMPKEEAPGTHENLLSAAKLDVDPVPEMPAPQTSKLLPAFMGYKRRCQRVVPLAADAIVGQPVPRGASPPSGLVEERRKRALPTVHEAAPRAAMLDTAGPLRVTTQNPTVATAGEAVTPPAVEMPANPLVAPQAPRVDQGGAGLAAPAASSRDVRMPPVAAQVVSRPPLRPLMTQRQQQVSVESSVGVCDSNIEADFHSPVKPPRDAWAVSSAADCMEDEGLQPSARQLMGTSQDPFWLCFRDGDAERNYRLFSAVQHQPMDLLLILVGALAAMAYSRMRVRPDGSQSSWFAVNQSAEIYCVAQMVFSILGSIAIMLHRHWYVRNRDTLIMVRNLVLLFLSGVWSVPFTPQPECQQNKPMYNNFLTGLQLMQAFESWGSRIPFKKNLAFRSVCVVLCLLPICCACQGHATPWLCVFLSALTFAVVTHAVPLYINWRLEQHERLLFASLMTAASDKPHKCFNAGFWDRAWGASLEI